MEKPRGFRTQSGLNEHWERHQTVKGPGGCPGIGGPSNDNPFSEAHFKTLKYQPEFPKRFETINDARTFCRRLAAWYNENHHHAGIGLMTPDQIHFGQADNIHAARQAALDAAFLSTTERFVRKRPKPPQIPTAVWINPPKQTEPAQA